MARFTCAICGKKFKSLKSKQYHDESVTACPQRTSPMRIEKLHKCGICEKSFNRKKYLDRHVSATHKNMTIIPAGKKTKHHEWGPCGACGKKFKSMSSFLYHQKSKTACPLKADSERRGKFFKCGFCVKTFAQKKHLNQHESGVHKKTTISKCQSTSQTTFDAVVENFPLEPTEVEAIAGPSTTQSAKATQQKTRTNLKATTLEKHEIPVSTPTDSSAEQKIIRKWPHYNRIKTNRYIPPMKNKLENYQENQCKCLPSDVEPCGPKSGCLNYKLLTECDNTCPANAECRNQRFQNRIYQKVGIKHFKSKGWGLVAMQEIPRNTFVMEYVGELIDTEEFNRRYKQAINNRLENFYFMRMKHGAYIDSARWGNETRFMNHSCEPNCIPQKWLVRGQTRIGFFTSVDIPKVNFIHFQIP